MSIDKILKVLRFPNVFILLLIVFLSCALLICINFFTIKIITATRIYVNGESLYSKGQNNATIYLLTYLYTQDNEKWKLFQQELKVPQGDRDARIELSNGDNKEIIKVGFRAGRNNEEDLDDAIWLYRNFNKVSFFAKAIHEWEQGDNLIYQLELIGKETHEKITSGTLTPDDKQNILQEISAISQKLTINEHNFLNTLGEGSRDIKDILIVTNIVFILIIICSVSFYYTIMVKRLIISKKEIEDKNENLTQVNHELDRFVYSASHDLRSPITSLKGLIELTQIEDDTDQIREYLNLMHKSLTRQDQFINDIIDYSKNKRKQNVIEKVSLKELVDEAIAQMMHIENATKIDFKNDIQIDEIMSDGLRLKIIINNLISNAIKYADIKKPAMYISIKTFPENGFNKIEIADNGIGIKEEIKDRIFEMYFGTDKNKGSGLGLYIIKEAIENIKGNIIVASKENIGTKFIITIPQNNGI